MSLFLLRWIGYKRNWPLQDSDACHDTVLPTQLRLLCSTQPLIQPVYSCEPFKYKLNKFRAAASPRFPRTIAFNGLEQLARIPRLRRSSRWNFRFRLQFNFQSWKFRFEKKIIRWYELQIWRSEHKINFLITDCSYEWQEVEYVEGETIEKQFIPSFLESFPFRNE